MFRGCWIFLISNLLFTPNSVSAQCPLAEPELKHGLAFYQSDEFDQAVKKLQRAVRKDSKCTTAWLVLGHSQWQLRELKKSTASYRRALTLDPGLTEASTRLEMIDEIPRLKRAAGLVSGKVQHAIEEIDRFAGKRPDRLERAIILLGWYVPPLQMGTELLRPLLRGYRDANRPQDALIVAQVWLQAEPGERADVATHRGAAYLALGDENRARQAFDEFMGLVKSDSGYQAGFPDGSFLSHFGENWEDPQMARQEMPSFDPAVLAKGIRGTVRFHGVVGMNGRVGNLKLVQGLEPSIDQAVARTITGKWLFRPAHLGGSAIATRVNIEFQVNASGPPG